jgi:hypothetical protein
VRLVLLVALIVGLTGLAALDLAAGSLRTGVASLLLAVVNALLLA